MTPNNQSATTSINFKSLSITMEINPTAMAVNYNTENALLSSILLSATTLSIFF